MLDVDIDIVAGGWDPLQDWEAIARHCVAAALDGAGHKALIADSSSLVEVAVRLSDDAEVQALNRDWRGKDRPTNILSFPMLDEGGLARLGLPASDLLLGDLVLAHETVAAEAAARGLPILSHVSHLLVHGTLHLLGHDHQDDRSADAMEALETAILARLGIADPYADAGMAQHGAAGADSP